MPRTFNCPMCAAPLEAPQGGAMQMRCPYCGNTVFLPEELRGAGGFAPGPPAGSFGPMIDQALKLAEIKQLLHGGHKIEAIKLYRETFGVGLKEAKEAVERLEAGEPLVFANATVKAESQTLSAESFNLNRMTPAPSKKSRKGCWLVLMLILFVALGTVFALVNFTSREESAQTSSANRTNANGMNSNGGVSPLDQGFAKAVLEFGSEGMGAGQFKDARSVAVDPEGRIYVGERSDGRVQVFDAQGKFITQWMVDNKRALLNLAVDRQGTVYIVHPSRILRYEGATGNLLGEVERLNNGVNEFYSDVFVALDGSLYAIGSNSNIVHIGADGKIKRTINVAEKVGEDVDFERLAVSGAGDIYALNRTEDVFRFAPDGRYINRFGGRGEGLGQFRSANALAVDGRGRVYVSDSGTSIQVFDAGGRYLDSFGGKEVVFGLAINDRNEIFACYRNRYAIVKFVLNER